MKLNALESKDGISRREFLKIIGLKNHARPLIDKEKCTGCSLCAMDCPTKALILNQGGEKGSYQLLFRKEACNGCGACEKSCPENCLQLVEEERERNEERKEAEVIFEDNLSRCVECGIPLFPRSMVKKMENKISMNEKTSWPFELCPSCRMRTQFRKERVERIRT